MVFYPIRVKKYRINFFQAALCKTEKVRIFPIHLKELIEKPSRI